VSLRAVQIGLGSGHAEGVTLHVDAHVTEWKQVAMTPEHPAGLDDEIPHAARLRLDHDAVETSDPAVLVAPHLDAITRGKRPADGCRVKVAKPPSVERVGCHPNFKKKAQANSAAFAG